TLLAGAPPGTAAAFTLLIFTGMLRQSAAGPLAPAEPAGARSGAFVSSAAVTLAESCAPAPTCRSNPHPGPGDRHTRTALAAAVKKKFLSNMRLQFIPISLQSVEINATDPESASIAECGLQSRHGL